MRMLQHYIFLDFLELGLILTKWPPSAPCINADISSNFSDSFPSHNLISLSKGHSDVIPLRILFQMLQSRSISEKLILIKLSFNSAWSHPWNEDFMQHVTDITTSKWQKLFVEDLIFIRKDQNARLFLWLKKYH